ncbi:GNAT family N-acetyltransferase [Micromonospora sp. URMC 103]|uniref:GNAT family N-acetyltransferase n=1 Tax=Micromonospora sp. URMC 103 TaxID=3423406 RepID=UPI003F1A7C4D
MPARSRWPSRQPRRRRNRHASRPWISRTREFSTWQCREYAHLDCLFVDESHRGRGVGRLLVDAAVRQARAWGVGELQSPKRRYVLAKEPAPHEPR